jgi:predicted RNA-binding Zn-ribbon protein involved in translation (DUF1610 family)
VKPRIATFDIETSPYESYTWGLWQQNIGLDQIKKDRTILSVAYKPLGKAIEFRSTGGRGPERVRDDRALCEWLAGKLDATDIVVVQNGRHFDVRIVNARLIIHDIAPYSPIRVVDTKIVAKKVADFGSNRLEWLDRVVNKGSGKDKHPQFMGQDLWTQVLLDNPRAWKVMKKYNEKDVLKTEKLYRNLLPWIDQHPNVSVYTGKKSSCPNCGSTKLEKRGVKYTQASAYQQYHCLKCGAWPRGKTMLSSLAERKARLT